MDIYKKCIVEYDVIVMWCIMKHSKELFSTSVFDDVLLPTTLIENNSILIENNSILCFMIHHIPITYGQNMYRGVQGTHAYSN